MSKLLFVVNPISGGRDKTDLQEQISSSCKVNDIPFSILETKGKNDLELIQGEIDKYLPETVVACGGDGTINLVARAILGKQVNLAIVPLGSANGLANELLIPAAVKKALDVIHQKRVVKIDVLRINESHISLHLCDVGFNAKLIKHFDEGRMRGKMAYVAYFFKTLLKKSPRRYTFLIQGNRFSRRAEMVVFANASKYGTGAVVNPDGVINDQKFEVCIFKPHPWYAIFRLTFDFFTGRMKKSRYVKIISTDKVSVKANKAVTLQVDGEVIGEFKNIEVEMHGEQIPVIVSPLFKVERP